MSYPTAGHEYTIRNAEPGVEHPDRLYLRFYEITNPVIVALLTTSEPNFDIQAFRPLLERETDISCLEALLRPTPEDIVVVGVEDVVLDIADVIAHK